LRLDEAPWLAVTPHEPDASALLQRVLVDDPAIRMPLGREPLETEEIALLRAWIEAGAPTGDEDGGSSGHWAFDKPQAPDIPETQSPEWVRNPIDAFVLARLEQEGLEPAPEADRHTLIRRLSLDLTGLPPAPEAVTAFVNDERADAYDRLVSELLASPHYGERQALNWLDVARYADTHGYEKDRPRSIWPYRDWVINAFNNNLPYDRFIIEQLAGDLLPQATQDQIIATGFHRNTMFNEEGGIDAGEFRYEAVVDRTNTTATAFLGLTMACAQCHTHKYDPITHDEYFGFFALHNNTDDVTLPVRSEDLTARREQIKAQITGVEKALDTRFPPRHFEDDCTLSEEEQRARHLEERLLAWEEETARDAADWTVLNPVAYHSENGVSFEKLDDLSLLVKGDIPNTDSYFVDYATEFEGITALRLELLPHPSLPGGGPGRGTIMSDRDGDFMLSRILAEIAPWEDADARVPVTIENATHSFAMPERGVELALDGKLDTGWRIKGREGEAHWAVFEFAEPVGHAGGALLHLQLDQTFIHQHTIGRFRVSVTRDPLPLRACAAPAQVEATLLKPRGERSPTEQELITRHFLSLAPELEEAHAEIKALREEKPEYPTTLVLAEREDARVTHLYHRGEYLEERHTVAAHVPAVLPPLPEHAPRNRLTLAHWLVDAENPLTARVTMNRLWQELFGRGIVGTSEDFGVRGEMPSHPELLDWLALEFVRRDWDYQEMLRLIVTSSTYRQSSAATPELIERDPRNRLLARGPRYRVKAELVRDIMLAASGLLTREIGGPSVYPPMPEGFLTLTFDGGGAWPESEGPDRYRRGIYTYIKRTMPHPMLSVFDTPARDVTTILRNNANTPLQALSMLNDHTVMEAARAMAERVLDSGAEDLEGRVDYAFLRALSRPADEAELAWVRSYLAQQEQRLREQPDELRFAANTENDETDLEHATWTLLCRVLLNLDEAISKR